MSIDEVRLDFQDGGLGLLNIIIGLIMFGVALDLRAKDFVRIMTAPRGPMVGLVAQFVLLPAVSFLLTMVLNVPPSVALGMILIAACPGGNVSNFLTLLARGNVAMSITMTAISTLVAVVMTPVNLSFWGKMNPQTAELLRAIELDPMEFFQTILVMLGIPTLLGMAIARFAPELARRLHTPFKYFSILAFLTFVAIAFSRNVEVFLNHIHWIFLAVCLQNGAALAVGYFSAYLTGLGEADRRAIAIEVGIQNSALGLVLVFRFFDGLGGMALVAGWWGIWHIASGMTLAVLWARRPPAGVSAEMAP